MVVGLVSYGVYIPKYRIKVEEIARVWGKDPEPIIRGLRVMEKSAPDIDEDTVTIAVEAARYSVKRAGIDPGRIGALYVGSESHPYAVKPTGTIVAEAIGATPHLTVADYEFACKAGTAAMQTCYALVKAEMVDLGMAIGADVSQGAPNDALEFTAAAGGMAAIIGKGNDVVAEIEHTLSYTTDTPDFWRREGRPYPEHGGRFTGEPAYFKHIYNATKMLLDATSTTPEDYRYVVFHQPNGKFPVNVAKKLGFTEQQLLPGLVVGRLGNTYSASSMIGLAAVLDKAKPGDRILMTSFGSGAGSDAFSFVVRDAIEKIRVKEVPTVE
ncbi:hydroxymethylglutaryl-CoA synthase, partial [Methanosarcinales archaeon]